MPSRVMTSADLEAAGWSDLFDAGLVSRGAGLVGFKQSGTGAVDRTMLAKAREAVSIEDYGAISGADCYAAFNLGKAHAVAEGVSLVVAPAFPMKFATTPDFSSPRGRYKVDGTLKYIGAGGTAVILDGTAGAGNYGLYFGWGDTPVVQGSGTTTYGIQSIKQHHSRVDFRCTGATQTALMIESGVLGIYHVTASSNADAFVKTPITGIDVNVATPSLWATSNLFMMPILEGLNGTGILNTSGQYNIFFGGTSEGNGGSGYISGTDARNNLVVSLFCEENYGYDFYLGGYADRLLNCASASVGGVRVAGNRHYIDGGVFKTVKVLAGAKGTRISNTGIISVPNGGGGLDDASDTTVIDNVWMETAKGISRLPDKFPQPAAKRVGLMAMAAATQATVCSVSFPFAHGLTYGDSITFSGVGGMTELNGNTYQVEPYTVSDVYLLDSSGTAYINSTGFGAFTSGGGATFVGFTNSWATESGFDTKFFKTSDGIVQLQGVVSGGGAGTGAFTLPLLYRPAVNRHFICGNVGTGGQLFLTVTSAGLVIPNEAVITSLCGVSFLAEQ